MIYCKYCGVNISTKTNYCPLCHKKLDTSEKEKKSLIQTFPECKPQKVDKEKLTKILLLVLIPLFIGVSIMINLLTYSGVLWSMIETIGLIYIWLFFLWAIKHNGNWGSKLVLNAIIINIILVVISIFSSNLNSMPNIMWAITYCVPFVLSFFVVLTNIIILFQRFNIAEYILPQILLCTFCLIYFVFSLFGMTGDVIYPSAIAMGIAYATTLGLFAFSWKNIRNVFQRKFHI